MKGNDIPGADRGRFNVTSLCRHRHRHRSTGVMRGGRMTNDDSPLPFSRSHLLSIFKLMDDTMNPVLFAS